MRENGKERGRRLFWPALLAVLLAGAFPATRAHAFPTTGTFGPTCESAADGNESIDDLVEDLEKDVNDAIQELINFMELDVSKTATTEIVTRLQEYDQRLYPPLEAWWDDGKDDPNTSTLPALKAMARQISMAKMMQTQQIGAFIDARILNEKIRSKRKSEAEARRRYEPSDMSCQIDTLGMAQTKGYYMSRALNRSFAWVDTQRRNNYLETPVATASVDDNGVFVRSAHAVVKPTEGGALSEIKKRWDEYAARYCDPGIGDQGCATAGTSKGKNRDLPGFLWGDVQTLDLANDVVRSDAEAALRTLASPFVPPPMPARLLKTAAGQQEVIRRRSQDARLNTVYNVIGQLISERSGGTGADTNPIKEATGLPPNTVAIGASYSELRQALAKERFFNPLYAARLVNQPAAVQREQGALDVIQGKIVNDVYKRMEEMLFMEGASYAYDLDLKMLAGPKRAQSFKDGVIPIPPPVPPAVVTPPTRPPGGPLPTLPVVPGNASAGQRIAAAAQAAIGMSTADNPLTEGGNLGCALAVSRILIIAGYGKGEITGTSMLAGVLQKDPCYTNVNTGHITGVALEPGDILVTSRGPGGAGHTGVYVGGGKIISNNSRGFNGEADGIVKQNYTVDSWYSVTKRNPPQSFVFRRTCP